ncbi:hypothetical protein V7S43_002889 [Phytophthora oleae]|uniref:PX domain-containing protein n=1 Tax=Phytophthora oleae TaxID=2107226 RepID=A0ABD3FZ86_9STRA
MLGMTQRATAFPPAPQPKRYTSIPQLASLKTLQMQKIMLTANEGHCNRFADDPFLLKVSAPALQPKRVYPKCYSEPLSFLKNIDHIEISGSKTVNGVVFYVLDVYLHRQLSRIPTNNKYMEQPQTPQNLTQKQPDFRVLRRFSEFERLRERVTAASQQQLMATCPYCDSIRVFMFACYRRPTAFIKLCTGTETRKQLLAQFINRLVEYAVGHPKSDVNTRPQDVWCLGFQSIPVLVEQFVQLRCYVE